MQQQGTAPQPEQAADPAGYIAALRELRAGSGLTFRQIEQLSTERGRFLARSTIADMLSKRTLPTRETLTAYLAVVCPEDRARWLAAYERLRDRAAGRSAGGGSTRHPTPRQGTRALLHRRPTRALVNRRHPRQLLHRRGATVIAVCAVAGALTAAAAVNALRGGPEARLQGLSQASGLGDPTMPWQQFGGGWVRIRPVGQTDRCLGPRPRRNGSAWAVALTTRPCAGQQQPVTRLLLARRKPDLHQIVVGAQDSQWGCLAANADHSLLAEPRCRADDALQLFRIAPVGWATSGRYRVASRTGDWCLGLTEGRDTRIELIEETCTGAVDQEFLIEPVIVTGSRRP